jgi:hypothetical protein
MTSKQTASRSAAEWRALVEEWERSGKLPRQHEGGSVVDVRQSPVGGSAERPLGRAVVGGGVPLARSDIAALPRGRKGCPHAHRLRRSARSRFRLMGRGLS